MSAALDSESYVNEFINQQIENIENIKPELIHNFVKVQFLLRTHGVTALESQLLKILLTRYTVDDIDNSENILCLLHNKKELPKGMKSCTRTYTDYINKKSDGHLDITNLYEILRNSPTCQWWFYRELMSTTTNFVASTNFSLTKQQKNDLEKFWKENVATLAVFNNIQILKDFRNADAHSVEMSLEKIEYDDRVNKLKSIFKGFGIDEATVNATLNHPMDLNFVKNEVVEFAREWFFQNEKMEVNHKGVLEKLKSIFSDTNVEIVVAFLSVHGVLNRSEKKLINQHVLDEAKFDEMFEIFGGKQGDDMKSVFIQLQNVCDEQRWDHTLEKVRIEIQSLKDDKLLSPIPGYRYREKKRQEDEERALAC